VKVPVNAPITGWWFLWLLWGVHRKQLGGKLTKVLKIIGARRGALQICHGCAYIVYTQKSARHTHQDVRPEADAPWDVPYSAP